MDWPSDFHEETWSPAEISSLGGRPYKMAYGPHAFNAVWSYARKVQPQVA